MRLFLRAWRWLAIVAALAGGWTELRAQESTPANPLRRAAPPSAAQPQQRHSVLAGGQRQFTPHEVWGEETFDSQVQAALAIEQLPSPEETIGVAWDEPAAEAAQPPVLLPTEPSASAPSATLPRIGFSPRQEIPSHEAWPPIEGKLPPGTHYSPEGLAIWRRWQEPWFTHGDPNDPRRHIGVGQPLEGTSWRNRPWFAGAFFGGAFHGDLTDNVRQNNGSLMGLRLGWDLDHYYGIEGRYAFSNPQIMDGAGNSLGDAHDYLMDVSALYYPFGDARWRPYFGLGLGMATYRFRDETNERVHDSALSVPISVGVKYFYSPHFTLRLDAVDNVTLGSDNLDAMNNFFLLGSVEYRFGGRRPSYYPWHGGTAW
jgi:outer membrane protein with beta-barrel domain